MQCFRAGQLGEQEDHQEGIWAHAGAFARIVLMSSGTRGADVFRKA